jgi:two-component system chemotaxis sensor kinase CheA
MSMEAREFIRQFSDATGALMMFAFGLDDELGRQQFLEHVKEMRSHADAQGFAPLAEVVSDLDSVVHEDESNRMAALQTIELRIYEKLAEIQEVSDGDQLDFEARGPASVLYLWAAERLQDNLVEVLNILDSIETGDRDRDLMRIRIILRHIYYACRHYNLETSSRYAMTLYDLYERIRELELPMDAQVVESTKRFVAELNGMMMDIDQGDLPSQETVYELMDQAPDLVFTVKGERTSRDVESSLGLPKQFHRVLTPDNIEAITQAQNDNKNFYVIRIQMNHDEVADMAFMQWISQGHSHVISNVTVLSEEGQFDLLVASDDDETILKEKLTELDEGRGLVHLTHTL